MRSVAWYVVGFLTALIVAVIAGVVLLNKTAHGFSANAPPTLLEVWAARKARDLALPNTEKQRTNPILNTPRSLAKRERIGPITVPSATRTTGAAKPKWGNICIPDHRICGSRTRKS